MPGTIHPDRRRQPQAGAGHLIGDVPPGRHQQLVTLHRKRRRQREQRRQPACGMLTIRTRMAVSLPRRDVAAAAR